MAYREDAERQEYEDVHDFNKNWFDRASHPEFRQYEDNILSLTKKLHDNYFEWGFLTIDSSEAIYCALLIHLLSSGKRDSSPKPNFVISELGHIAYKKASVLLGVEMREIGISDKGDANLSELRSNIDEGTFAVIGIAGSTALGNYDDIKKMDEICAETNIPIHVDAAIGGFIYPFKKNRKIPSDFNECKAIASLNISGHKYGYSRPSVGILLLKDKNILSESLYPFSVPYLMGSNTEEFGIIGSKPAIGVIDLNYNVTSWGEKGYSRIVKEVFEKKDQIVSALRELGQIEVLDTEDTPIFLITGSARALDKLSADLEKNNLSGKINTLFRGKPAIRIVVRKHFTDHYIDKLLKTIKGSIK